MTDVYRDALEKKLKERAAGVGMEEPDVETEDFREGGHDYAKGDKSPYDLLRLTRAARDITRRPRLFEAAIGTFHQDIGATDGPFVTEDEGLIQQFFNQIINLLDFIHDQDDLRLILLDQGAAERLRELIVDY